MLKFYIAFFFLLVSTAYAQNTAVEKSDVKQALVGDEKITDFISLYPNPAKDVLHVRTENIVITRVEIYSLLGGKAMIIKSNFKSIFIGDLLRGIYMVKVYSRNSYTVKKLIIR
jgi:hypothetical protein